MDSIDLWHGGSRWYGGAEIRPAKKDRYECGVGIYLTNQYLRAKSYAAGPGVTTRVKLAPRGEIRWLEDANLRLADILEFIHSFYRLRGRDQLIQYLSDNYPDAEFIPAPEFVNMCIEFSILAGKQGVEITHWLVEQGIDASLHTVDAGEQWVIVFNPRVIRKSETVPPSKVLGSDYSLPLVKNL